MEQKATNVVWHHGDIKKADREKQLNQKGIVLWFTGLSGAGKSTLAVALESYLHQQGKVCYRLDGDNVRHGLNKDLGFSDEDRAENIRRIGELAALFADAGLIVMASFISPFKEDRENARKAVAEGEFVEVYVECDLEHCELRDPKGLYKKARAGEIKDFTGIDSPYEEPETAEIRINTANATVEESLEVLVEKLQELGVL